MKVTKHIGYGGKLKLSWNLIMNTIIHIDDRFEVVFTFKNKYFTPQWARSPQIDQLILIKEDLISSLKYINKKYTIRTLYRFFVQLESVFRLMAHGSKLRFCFLITKHGSDCPICGGVLRKKSNPNQLKCSECGHTFKNNI